MSNPKPDTRCRWEGCPKTAVYSRAGWYCHAHLRQRIEWAAKHPATLDDDGEGDAMCPQCGRRAPIRGGKYLRHVVSSSECPWAGKPLAVLEAA